MYKWKQNVLTNPMLVYYTTHRRISEGKTCSSDQLLWRSEATYISRSSAANILYDWTEAMGYEHSLTLSVNSVKCIWRQGIIEKQK